MKKAYIALLLTVMCRQAAGQSVVSDSTRVHQHSACDGEETMKEKILDEVTVIGVTGTLRMKEAAAPYTVITPKQLHSSIGTNIVDMISHKAGVAQISTGVGIGKPVIRGLGYNRVVVVEQGIRQEGQQWGDEHGIEVDAEGVHSVEILKGPASLMYGSDAIAGVMILHPENPLEEGTIQFKVGTELQSNNGLRALNAASAGNIGGWLWNMHVSDKSAHCYKNAIDGYIPGSWMKENSVQAMLGRTLKEGHAWLRFSHLSFTPGITEGERGEDGLLEWEERNTAKSRSLQTPFQRVKHTKFVSDNAFHIGQGTLKAVVGYQQNYRREYEENTSEAELAMRLHTVTYDMKYQLALSDNWKIATGIGGMWQKNVNEAEEMLIPDYTLTDAGAFATASWKSGRWTLSGGVRGDTRHINTRQSEENFAHLNLNFSSATGSLGAVVNLGENTNLRMNVARGFRAPTVNELSSNGVHEGSIQYELGNAGLKPEHSLQFDLGLDHTCHLANIQASIFVNNISNYIFLQKLAGVMTDGYQTYQYRQGNARLVGGEAGIDIHPVNELHFENSLCCVIGTLLHQPKESHHLPMMPATRWNSNVRYDLPPMLCNRLQRTYISAGMEYFFRQDNYYALDDTETATPDYALVNIALGTDLHMKGHNCIEIGITCQNLFDKVYQNHLSRLKYASVNKRTGRMGISGMGRNVCVKVAIPIDIHMKERK